MVIDLSSPSIHCLRYPGAFENFHRATNRLWSELPSRFLGAVHSFSSIDFSSQPTLRPSPRDSDLLPEGLKGSSCYVLSPGADYMQKTVTGEYKILFMFSFKQLYHLKTSLASSFLRLRQEAFIEWSSTVGKYSHGEIIAIPSVPAIR
jgi:hypothetical protein